MTSRITDRIASIGLPANEKGRLAAALGCSMQVGLVEVNAVGVLRDRNHLDDAPDWVGDQAESARDEQAELDEPMLLVLLKVDAVGVLRDSDGFDDSPNPGGDAADAAGHDGDDQLNHAPAGVAGKEVVDAEMADEHS